MAIHYFYHLGSNLHSFASAVVDCTDEWEIPRDCLVIGQKIGEGQFGLVLEGTLMTGEYKYACRVFNYEITNLKTSRLT